MSKEAKMSRMMIHGLLCPSLNSRPLTALADFSDDPKGRYK